MGNQMGRETFFGVFFQIEWSRKVEWVDDTNVPSLSYLPVPTPPCNLPLQLTPARGKHSILPTLNNRTWCEWCRASSSPESQETLPISATTLRIITGLPARGQGAHRTEMSVTVKAELD